MSVPFGATLHLTSQSQAMKDDVTWEAAQLTILSADSADVIKAFTSVAQIIT